MHSDMSIERQFTKPRDGFFPRLPAITIRDGGSGSKGPFVSGGGGVLDDCLDTSYKFKNRFLAVLAGRYLQSSSTEVTRMDSVMGSSYI